MPQLGFAQAATLSLAVILALDWVTSRLAGIPRPGPLPLIAFALVAFWTIMALDIWQPALHR